MSTKDHEMKKLRETIGRIALAILVWLGILFLYLQLFNGATFVWN